LISSLYYTHAPQLLHASQPTHAFSHTQDAPCDTVASRTTQTQDTNLDVPDLRVLSPWSYKLLASSVVILTLLLEPRRLFDPVKGRWTKSSDFVLTNRIYTTAEPLLPQGHVIHAHPTYGTKSYVLPYPRTLRRISPTRVSSARGPCRVPATRPSGPTSRSNSPGYPRWGVLPHAGDYSKLTPPLEGSD